MFDDYGQLIEDNYSKNMIDDEIVETMVIPIEMFF